jgi:hypothetical protein
LQPTTNKAEAEKTTGTPVNAKGTGDSDQLLEIAHSDTDAVLKNLETQLDGLSEAEARSRLNTFGP